MVIEYNNGFRNIPGVSFDANRWYHVAVVYTSGNAKTYVNGALVDDFAYSQAALNGANVLRIGRHNDDSGFGSRRFFAGAIDEVQIFPRALTASEINATYSAGSRGTCTGIVCTPASLAFGNVTKNKTSGTRTLAVKVGGTSAFNFGAPSLTNNFGADFRVTGNSCTGTKAAGSSCAITLTFTPRAAVGTAESETLTVRNPNGTLFQTVALSGTSAAPVTVTPTNLAFGNVRVNTTSAAKTVTIKNTQTGSISVARTISGTGYKLAGGTCKSSLAAGKSCTVSVTFKPTSTGAKTGTLSINAGGGVYAVALTGTGV